MDKMIEFLHLSAKNKKTPEEIHAKIIEHVKTSLGGKKVSLKRIDPEKSWGREHCEYCFKDLDENEEAYTEAEEKYWLCKDCFEKHRKELELKS